MSRHRIRASTEFFRRRPGVRELKIALCTCGSLAKTALFIQASWSFNLLNLLVTNQHFNIQLHAVRTDSWGPVPHAICSTPPAVHASLSKN